MFDLHLGAVREVTSRDSMLLLDLGENYWKLVNQIVFLAFFAKKGWHLLLKIADNVCVSLGREQSPNETQDRHNCSWFCKYLPKVWVTFNYMR